MRITVRRSGNAISETARDLQAVPVNIRTEGGALVHRNADRLNRFARNIARSNAGPHGALFYKRITAEMTGALSAEIGPSAPVAGSYVGVDGSEGPGRDLDAALVKGKQKFYDDASDLMDDLL